MSLYNHKESQEMYLKTIFKLNMGGNSVRAVDICDDIGYAKSSVSRALKLLEQDGYITKTSHNIIRFTPKGEKTAEFVYTRYFVLVKMLQRNGLNIEEAKETACSLEHLISEPVYFKIKNFLEGKTEISPSS